MGTGRLKNSAVRLRNGLTLIELLVAISIATILTGVVIMTLQTSFTTFAFSQEQILLEKALDEALDSITGATIGKNGAKDALEILEITPTSIAFVPMWIGTISAVESGPILLSPPLKAGTSLPIVESAEPGQKWRAIPITFIPADPSDPDRPKDSIILNETPSPTSTIRLIYQPDAELYPDCALTIKWDNKNIIRTYKGANQTIPQRPIPGVVFTDFLLQYFDNTNTEIQPNKDEIPNITALKITLTAALNQKGRGAHQDKISKTGFAFISLRNTRSGGAGLLIRQGTHIKIPDSRHIRMFSLTNVTGAKEGGTIELEAKAEKTAGWKVIVDLGVKDNISIIKRYTIEYPIGTRIHSETLDLRADAPLNFMNLGPSASYGWAQGKRSGNTIDLTGDVELTVTKMDAKGAMLFIRP